MARAATVADRFTRDRSWLALAWYRLVTAVATLTALICYGIRATGRRHVPRRGGALLVSNHLSHLDVFALGVSMPRPLNYVARSTLFVPVLGFLIRSVGGFAIQREGRGASGFKETLRRVRAGGIVVLFPEGTRSHDGEIGLLKPGIAAVASRAGVPIVPAALAGTFEAWPRQSSFPIPYPIRVHFGPPIPAEALGDLDAAGLTTLIRERLLECQRVARRGLARDLGRPWVGPPLEQDPDPGR